MVDFKKHLPEAQRTTQEIGELQVAAARRWALRYGLDPRSAAEIMRDVVMPIMGPVVGVLGQYHAVEPAVSDWNMYANPAGPRASQIFSAAVMREQVDPA